MQRYLLPVEEESALATPPTESDLRSIPGVPGYGINKDGRIWSHSRNGLPAGRWLCPRKNGQSISLYVKGKGKSYTIKYLLSVTWEKK